MAGNDFTAYTGLADPRRGAGRTAYRGRPRQGEHTRHAPDLLGSTTIMAKKQRSKRRRSTRTTNRRLPWIVGIVGAVLLIATPITVNMVRAANLPGERFASQGNRHVALGASIPPYNSDPPTSGPHTADLASWGTYEPGEAPEDMRLVHNMEDGGVVLWYEPGDTEEETSERISALEGAARSYRRIVIVPREDMPTPYAATAWQRLQRFEDADLDGMREFVNAFEGIDHHPY